MNELEVCQKYSVPLLEPWEGYKAFLHGWHEKFLLYWLTYGGYCRRLVEIEQTKTPEFGYAPNEREVRIKHFRPVVGILPADLEEAGQAYETAWQAYETARQTYGTAWQVCKTAWQAYVTARQAYVTIYEQHRAELEALHARECDCKYWKPERQMMVFTEEAK